MKYLDNLRDVNLLTWETNPSKRNKNNEITFVAKEHISVNINDVIRSLNSCYKITGIIEQREAALTGYINYKVISKWYNI